MAAVAGFLQGKRPCWWRTVFFSKMATDRGISLSCFFGRRGYFGSLKWLVDVWQLILIGIGNEENDCQSHICEPLFSHHSKTMMLKTKVDIHVFSAVEKIFLCHTITRKHYFRYRTKINVSNKQVKIWCKSQHDWLWFCMKLYVTP